MKTFIERKHAAEMGNYAYDFWADMKKRNDACFSNLSEGLTGSKTYVMPALSEKAYCKACKENSLFRKIATSVAVCDNDFSIFAVDGREPSSWVEEGGQVPTTDCVSDFTRYPIQHHKLATILRLHDDVITDSQFDIEGYLVKRLARNFAKAEDDAFINGTGIHMPTGILKNEKYTGNAILGKTYKPDVLSKRRMKNTGQAPMYYAENTHPAIITQEMFNMVQAEMQRRIDEKDAAIGSNRYTSKYPFSGLLVCGTCGHRLRRHVRTMGSGKTVAAWGCTNRISNGRTVCDSHHINEDVLERTYRAAMESLIGSTDDVINTVAESCGAVLSDGNHAELDTIQ